MELEGYRENYGMLRELFPDQAAITVEECAKAMGTSTDAVYTAIHRAKNPLPSCRMGNRKIVIPIPRLARWMCLR